ncbi:MAG: hypothetical protein GYB66_05725, partial [Chloroflexi bacterium]|nr:hypothetical protein [Chloroflexota bacterium]
MGYAKLIMGLVLLAALAGAGVVLTSRSANATLAQNPEIPTPVPGCEPYHPVFNTVNIRACANSGCSVVDQVSAGTTLCVRGEADNSNWLQVDLTPLDGNSDFSYVSRSVVAPGVASAQDLNVCQGYLVAAESATLYQCADTNCKALGQLPQYGWVCAYDYGGDYAGWLYAQDSDLGTNGWVQASLMERTSTTNTAPQAAATSPSSGAAGTSSGSQTTTQGLPTITPAAATLTALDPLPACQVYHVVADGAQARTCAGANCPVESYLQKDELLCIRGITDNPRWFLVDLYPDDETSVLYAIDSESIAPGEPSLEPEYCEPWEVTTNSRPNLRSCPSLTCPIVSTLSPEDWICAVDFGGQYFEWVYAYVPDQQINAWIHGSIIREMQIEGTPTDIPGTPTVDPDTAEPSVTATPSPTLTPTVRVFGGTPEVIPSATPSSSEPEATLTPSATLGPVCLNYVVAVAVANVRSCPSTNCDAVTQLNRNAPVCVIGPAPNLEDLWLVVDLDPNDPNNAEAFMSQTVLTPDESSTATPTPSPTSPVNELGTPQPTGTPLPASPTPIFTPEPTSPPAGDLLAQELTIGELGVNRTIELRSPQGANRFRFQIPANWFPDGSNILYLNINYTENRSGVFVQG